MLQHSALLLTAPQPIVARYDLIPQHSRSIGASSLPSRRSLLILCKVRTGWEVTNMIRKSYLIVALALIGLITLLMAYASVETAWALNPQPLPPGIMSGTARDVGKVNLSPSDPRTRPPVDQPQQYQKHSKTDHPQRHSIYEESPPPLKLK